MNDTESTVAGVAALSGRRLLLVEDEPLIAMLVEDMLSDLNIETAATVETVPAAMAAVEGGAAFDGAILDMNLRGRSVEPVAEALAQRGLPFIFASGGGQDEVLRRHAAAPVLLKPFRREALEAALVAALGASGG